MSPDEVNQIIITVAALGAAGAAIAVTFKLLLNYVCKITGVDEKKGE